MTATESLVIPAQGPHRLTFDWDGRDAWAARLDAAGLVVRIRVELGPPNPTGDTIADLFAELSERWRGWTGERRWVSRESELELAAAHDGRGHIALRVRMSNLFDPAWEASATLGLEPGGLTAVARDARRFVDRQPAL